MGEADNESAEHGAADADPPLTVELLADLQAGLLDDDAAARIRQRVRDDPAAEEILRALNRVRSDVAAMGADPASAPDVPPHVTARISAALRTAGDAPGRSGAAHSARPQIRPAKVAAMTAGVGAVVAAIGVGTAALVSAPEPAPSTPATAEHITVSTPPMTIPLSQAEILGLLDHSPDFGPLADPARRASCLSGLGYPASTRVLGARPIDINARPGVLLLLPGEAPADVAVFAVAVNCSAADTGLLANTQVSRP
jgi:hypothetical protein